MPTTSLRRALATAGALFLLAACADEFSVDPPDGFTATIEQDWDDELIVGDTVVLRAEVRDEASGARVDPAALDWTAAPSGRLELLSADSDSARFRVAGIGPVEIGVSLDDPAFDTASVSATLQAVLAGIAMQPIANDSLDSFGAALAVRVTGLDRQGNAFPSTGFSWEVRGAAITAAGSSSVDSLRVVAAANGTAWVVVSHAQCSSTGTCIDSVLVTVQQAPASVVLPADLTLRAIGATTTIAVEARDAGGSVIAGAPVVLSQVDGAGNALLSGTTVTAISTGSARIAATLGALADTVTVTVTQVPYFLELSPDSVQFGAIGNHVDVTLSVKDSLGTTVPGVTGIVWETTSGTVVSVDPDSDPISARIEAEGNGTAIVRARLGSLVAETHVTVTQVATSLVALGGAGQSGLVNTLLADSLRIEARDAGGSGVAGVPVTWTVLLGGGSVAGTTTTNASGRAAVAWTLGGLVGTQQVRATIAGADPVLFSATGLTGVATQLSVTPPSALLTFIQDTAHLAAVARDAFGNVVPAAVTWSSTNESVATVGANGVVTATGNGTASIVAQAGLLADTSVVTVQQQVASITLGPASADTLSAGDTLRLVATARDSSGTTIAGAVITWTSTDTVVASVDATGKVAARARGVATIRAASNGAQASFGATVAAFALGFDGGDVLEVANSAGGPLNLGSAFTIELWVRPRSTTGGTLIGIWNEGQKVGSSYALALRGLVPRGLTRNAIGNEVDSVSATLALVPDAWHHVAFVFQDSVGTIYVNGVLAGTTLSMTLPQQQTSAPLRIGADATCTATGTCFVGDIDEIRIWSRARSAAELLAEQALRLNVQTGLSLYFPLYLGMGDPVDLVGGLIGVRGDNIGPAAAPAWIIDGSPAP